MTKDVAAVEPPPAHTAPAPSAPTAEEPTGEPPAPDRAEAETSAREIGCWEREYGRAPATEALDPALAQKIPDCPDCPHLHAGPAAVGLHAEVIGRLHRIASALPEPSVPEPVIWINSGAREGPASKSMHNQALAVDLVICGMTSPETAAHLRKAGFTCVIEYYDGDGKPCNMAHGDLRGTKWATGAYAPGGWKSKSCPERATSRGEDCQGQHKADWSYTDGEPK